MNNPWIVEPEEVQLDLEWMGPDGETRRFWVSAKKYLTVGEQRRMLKAVSHLSSPVPRTRGEQVSTEARFEWTEYSIARALAYLSSWSLPMKIERASLESLHADLFEIIDNAIDAHQVRMDEEKKARRGATAPLANSA